MRCEKGLRLLLLRLLLLTRVGSGVGEERSGAVRLLETNSRPLTSERRQKTCPGSGWPTGTCRGGAGGGSAPQAVTSYDLLQELAAGVAFHVSRMYEGRLSVVSPCLLGRRIQFFVGRAIQASLCTFYFQERQSSSRPGTAHVPIVQASDERAVQMCCVKCTPCHPVVRLMLRGYSSYPMTLS